MAEPLARAIRFGTDGWRAVLGEGFTTDRFAMAVDAIAAVPEVTAARSAGRPLVVAYDTRFLADRFAALAAERLAARGFRVLLARAPAATPGCGAAILAHEAALGLMITASHNPPRYLGLKIKGAYGGSATPAFVAEVERALATTPEPEALVAFPEGPAGEPIDVEALHRERLLRFVEPSPGRIGLAHDAMFGSGQGLLAELLAPAGERVVRVRHGWNPGFGGVPPEPIAAHLDALRRAVRRNGLALGVATDGDADRVAAVDAEGRFVFPHEIFALLVGYLVDDLGRRGRVVMSVSTSELVRRVAEDRGLEVTVVPVGFKHTVGEILAGGVLIGGEESGGIAVVEHLPERDGILCGLLLRELLLRRGRSLRALLDELQAHYGPLCFRRRDLHLAETTKAAALAALESAPPEEVAGRRVERIERADGFKFWFADGGWLLVRPSGTEPILRTYTEADNLARVRATLDAFEAWVVAHGA